MNIAAQDGLVSQPPPEPHLIPESPKVVISRRQRFIQQTPDFGEITDVRIDTQIEDMKIFSRNKAQNESAFSATVSGGISSM